MRQSFLATKTKKESSTDEISNNANLLIRAGYIHKTMAGAYSFLPIGLRSINKIIEIIREEMNAIKGQEISMSSLQNVDLWKKSKRWDIDGIWFKSNIDAGGGEVGFGWTHEEALTEIMTQHINSYRDLPLYLYQFQTKFRNEKRAKSGIMRTREFIMKDLYSFSKNEEEHKVFYEECAKAYIRIFDRVGLGDDTYRTFASGGDFAEFSDEFQTLTPAGEDVIYVNKEKKMAVNKEVYDKETLEKLGMSESDFEELPASEVGNIFTLGTRFSEALDLNYTDKEGKQQPVFMGSYGIGPARLLGVAVEKNSNKDGMILPESIAPFSMHLILIGNDSDEVKKKAEEVYEELKGKGVDILFDDRDVSAGEKLADSDLIGIPKRLVISKKTLENNQFEYKDRILDEEKNIDGNVEAILKNILWENS